MATNDSSLLSRFDERGFAVIPGFLSGAELDVLVQDFEAQPPATNANYNLRGVGDALGANVSSGRLTSMAELMKQVAASTSTTCDRLHGGHYLAVRDGIHFGFHQDHECYWMHQNVHDYLNFYVPIIKPVREKSNLDIVPFDRMPTGMRDALLGQGATRFIPNIGRYGAFSDDSQGTIRCHATRDLHEILETPHLSAGDLLLMRGDMLHRTQDTETDRVAVSFRASSSSVVVRRDVLVSGGLHKLIMILRDPAPYSAILAAFAQHGENELSVGTLMKTIEHESPSLPEGDLLRQMLAQRSPQQLHALQYEAFLLGLPRAVTEKLVPLLDEVNSFSSSG